MPAESCALVCAWAILTREARGEGEELTECEAFYVRDRTGASLPVCLVRVRRPQGAVNIVQLLSSVRLQFLSGNVLDVMCTGMFLCTSAADDRLGNASEA